MGRYSSYERTKRYCLKSIITTMVPFKLYNVTGYKNYDIIPDKLCSAFTILEGSNKLQMNISINTAAYFLRGKTFWCNNKQ